MDAGFTDKDLLKSDKEQVISPGKQAFLRFIKNKLSILGAMMMVLLVMFVVVGPFLWGVDPNKTSMKEIYRSPFSASYPLGTDDLGRDELARLMYGGRVSLAIGLCSALVAISFGSMIGALAGFYGGFTDSLLMRLTDVMLTIPTLPLLIVMGGIFRPSAPLLVGLISVLNWMTTARLVRGNFLTLRTLDYVKAARAIGCRNNRIIFRYLIPNTIGPIVVTASLTVGRAIIMESTLSFLGVGINPPTATWGNMLQSAQTMMTRTPWLAVLPGFMILMTVLSVNFIGDGLNDALDPRQTR